MEGVGIEEGDTERSLALAREIEPMLQGQGPHVQGATLSCLLAIWLAGHHPKVREQLLAMHVRYARELIPTYEKERGGL